MSALFTTEVSTLEAQVAALQAQIASAQERIGKLAETETLADSWLEAGAVLKEKVSALAPEALSKIKSSIFNLFQGGNNSDDGKGNEPINPAPQPGGDGGSEVVVEPEQGSSAVEAVDAIAVSPEVSLEVSPEASPEVPQPEPQSEPEQLASDFQKEVQARGIQTICSSDGTPKFDLIWTRLSDRVATYSSPENPYNWEHGFVSYLGFATKEVAESWQQHLLKTGAVTKCIIRKVNRLKVDTPKGVRIRWEMKCHGLSESQLQNILTFDLTQPPVIEAKASQSEDNVSDLDITLCKFQSGDRIKVIEPGHPDKDAHGTVKRLVMVDGVVAVGLDSSPIERLYPPHFIEPLKVADLELVVTDEPAEDIPAIDWEAEAKESGVRLDYSAPGHYIAYHKYRKLGEVIERRADSPYYVNRNQRTMLSVGNGDGQKYSNPYECAIGLAKFLKLIVEPEVAKADLFGGGYDVPAPQQQNTEFDGNHPAPEQEIEAQDWVELLVNGDRYQVAEVDSEGIHLVTGDGNMLAQPDEVKLLFRVPANWKPF